MRVRIGFIGTGGIASAHLERLLQVPEADVVALCDIDHNCIEATRVQVNGRVKERGLANRSLDALPYTDYRSMLRSEKPHAVYVCLPPFAHGDAEAAVIEAGAHLFVEKPVALELPVAARTLQQLHAKGLMAAVGYQLRYLTSMEKARELLKDQTVGMALVMRSGGVPTVPWYHIQSKSGGQLVEMATHHIDQLRYLIGEVDTVYAAGATRIHHKRNPEFDVFDVNCMTLTFENGVVANFANNLISGHGAPKTARGLHIMCDGMTLSWNLGTPLQVLTQDGVEEIADPVDAMLAQDQAFVRAVATGNRDLIKSDYASGIRTLAVTLAGELSARRHLPIHIAELLQNQAPSVLGLGA